MNFAPFFFLATSAAAWIGVTHSASALPANDPRIAINAVNTPGDATAVFRIANPGSYYLEADLLGEAGKAGILVDASDVRIDLMGFHLRGQAGTTRGITNAGAQSNIVIWNGTLTEWNASGVHFGLSTGVQVRDLSIRSIIGAGIVLGIEGAVERCHIIGTSDGGVRTGAGAYVSQTMVSDTLGVGIEVSSYSLVRDCKVRGSMIHGIRSTGQGASILGSAVNGGPVGIYAFGTLVADCTVTATGNAGMYLEKSTVRDSLINGNSGHGIVFGSLGGVALRNQVFSNGADGIRADGNTRIEENDVRSHSQGIGIRTSGTGSFVVKNTLFTNATHLSVPNSGNFVGPLVSTNAVNGRNEPWANIYGN